MVIVKQSPAESATSRSQHGADATWGLTEHLLATAADELAVANWQRQGKQYAPKPKPIPRPGKKSETRQIGSEPLPISELDAWIAEAEAA